MASLLERIRTFIDNHDRGSVSYILRNGDRDSRERAAAEVVRHPDGHSTYVQELAAAIMDGDA